MPSYRYLDKEGTRILWEKMKVLVEGQVMCYRRTAQEWNQDPNYMSQAGVLYIYENYKDLPNGTKIANFKVGDGVNYLIDLPFVNADLSQNLYQHVNNSRIHITDAERNFWNNKITAYQDVINNENLILTKN